jgi:Uma2 family endonuclease
MSDVTAHLPSKDGEPAWEAAYFFPPQGRWSEETFLQFHSNRMAELVAGRLEILPTPTLYHQRILRYLLGLLENAKAHDGLVLFAPLPVKLFPGTIREPDLIYIDPGNVPDDDDQYPSHVDLAIEIVSPGPEARKRDYEDKRIDYAKAGVSEYWIVDPQEQLVTVLTLDGQHYIEHGVFAAGQTATSRLLPDLTIPVDAIWALAKSPGKSGR